MKFSERKGLRPVATVLQREEMSPALRNTLWNALLKHMAGMPFFLASPYEELGQPVGVDAFAERLWFDHYKLPIDERPPRQKFIEDLKVRVLKGKWFDVYDLLEAILEVIDDERLEESLNSYLERELAGYRIVDQLFVEITAADEIAAVEEAIEEGGSGASEHLRTALSHLADRSAPDYRNSIKESICAVESMARVVTGNEKATLGEALKTLESNGLHKALRDGFNKLYGYTSDEHGIRHAMLEEPNLTASDAKFFLVACSAFVNYLRASMPTRSAG